MPQFKVNTNWCVITGAPSSGKTSVIDVLAQQGYQTEEEAARDLIQDCLRHGLKLADVQNKKEWLQDEILRLKQERERRQDPKALVFLDRGIPDSITYFRIAGIDLSLSKAASLEFHYQKVFVFDRLPIVQDGVRIENEQMARRIDLELEQDYKDLGYSPVRVPVMPIADRAAFVLSAIKTKA